LGQTIGAYAERPPGVASLRRHFSCTWFHAVPAAGAPPAIIVPDGAADLIWIGGELRVAGPDRSAAVERLPPGGTVVGLRFRPGAAPAWLGVPLAELVGCRLSLDQFWGRGAGRLADWLGEANDHRDAARRLEQALARAVPPVPSDEFGLQIVETLRRHRGVEGRVVAELAHRLGVSERTVRRRCVQAVGYGPKTLDRIVRLQRFLALARANPRSPLAALAATSGYADQAHLSRETGALVGATPGLILCQLRQAVADPSKT